MAKGKWEKWTEPNNLLILGAWARDGLTDEDIAHNIGISRSTLKEWKKKIPAISATLNTNKAIADIRVENALFKKAIGCTVKEKVISKIKNPDGTVTETERTVERELPPDTTAGIFWLKNRKPKDWRDKQEVELSGNVGMTDALKKARERVNEHRNSVTLPDWRKTP